MYSRKQRRFYGRCMSGLTRPGVVRLMTLTSSTASPDDIHRSFRVLKERIRRRWPFEYITVREHTDSGLAHLHIVYRGGYIPQAWLSTAWAEVHQAPIVDVRMGGKAAGMAKYLTKYVGKTIEGRYWSSWGWIYRGWRIVHGCLFRNDMNSRYLNTFADRVEAWNRHLRGLWLWYNCYWIPPPCVMTKRFAQQLAV